MTDHHMPNSPQTIFAAKVASLLLTNRIGLAMIVAAGCVGFIADVIPQEVIWPIIEKTGALGVLAWFLWYSTSRAQPQMMASYAAMIEKLAASYTATTKDMLISFAAELRDMRDDNEKWRDHHSSKIIQP